MDGVEWPLGARQRELLAELALDRATRLEPRVPRLTIRVPAWTEHVMLAPTASGIGVVGQF